MGTRSIGIRRQFFVLTLAVLVVLGAILPAMTAAAAPPPQPAQCCQGFWYVVKRGDSLSGIAIRFGTTVRAIKEANGIENVNLIYVGQRLWIPACRPAPPGPSCRLVHVVKRGETLSSIARMYGVSVKALMRANGIHDPNRIWVGQRLCIPNPLVIPSPLTECSPPCISEDGVSTCSGGAG